MKYLMIENPGEAPLAGFTLAGASSKTSDHPRQIGMFGTGTKESVLLLIRRGRTPVVYCGKDRIKWFVQPVMVAGKEHLEVFYQVNDRAAVSTQTTTTKGSRDWDNEGMAVREFVSNALDQVNGNPNQVTLKLMDPEQVRARKGYTRVFIPHWDAPVEATRDHIFLHWTSKRDVYQPFLIEKPKPSPAKFYRRGVLVREIEDISAFDYNLDVSLDEARKMEKWSLTHEAARLLSSSAEYMAKALQVVSTYDGPLIEKNCQQWSFSFSAQVVGEIREALGSTIVTNSQADVDFIKRKGAGATKVLQLPETWANALRSADIGRIETQFGDLAHKRMEMLDHGPKRLEWLPIVIKLEQAIVKRGLTCGRPAPRVGFFRQAPGESIILGVCILSGSDEGVWLNVDIGEGHLLGTLIEEMAHWYSQTKDFTREFQEWLVEFAARGFDA